MPLSSRRHALVFIAVVLELAPGGWVAAQGIHQAVREGDRARVEELLAQDASLLEAPDGRGLTPLAVALASGGLEVADALMAAGADPLSTTGRMTPADLAFQADCQRGGTANVTFLMDHGVALDPDAPVLGRPKLLLAIPLGNEDMVRLLLHHGADPSLSGPRGITALGDAARRGRASMVSMLLEAGVDPNTSGMGGNPPLYWAVDRGHASVVASLLEGGASPTFTEPKRGRSLLHVAAIHGHLDIAEALLRAGADALLRDRDGRTPLYFAARYGHRSVSNALVDAGAHESEVEVRNTHPSPYLADSIAEGELAGWYLANRGLALKTAHHLLVFDAEEFGVARPTEPGLANGFLNPSEIGGENVVAFYSAYHGSVDEPAYVHTIADSVTSAAFVHLEADAFRGSDRAVFVSPRDGGEAGGVSFVTAGTMTRMPTLAYLLEVDGLAIYYQGFGTDDLDYYTGEMAFLEGLGRPLDLAVVAIPDGGVEEAEAYLQVLVERLRPSVIALHTPPFQFDILPQAAELLRTLGFQGAIHVPENPGDMFLVGR